MVCEGLKTLKSSLFFASSISNNVCVIVAAIKIRLVSFKVTDKWLFNDYQSFPSPLQTALCWFYRWKNLRILLINEQGYVISRSHSPARAKIRPNWL